MKVEKEVFRNIATAVGRRFPHLVMTEGGLGPNVDALLEIPAQPGLAFGVGLSLQGDELHLNAGALWCEWFPCGREEVSSRFLEAVCGLLSGEFRIVEHRRGGRLLKAELQRPDGARWKNVATWGTWHLPLPFGVRRTILRNTT